VNVEQRLQLLDHAVWLHNAGIDPASVLQIAQTLCDWCDAKIVHTDVDKRVTGGASVMELHR
jgi:hypothetical protein